MIRTATSLSVVNPKRIAKGRNSAGSTTSLIVDARAVGFSCFSALRPSKNSQPSKYKENRIFTTQNGVRKGSVLDSQVANSGDITWSQAFQIQLQMFRTMLTDNTELSDEKINELVEAFMNTLPVLLKTQLQAA